MNSIKVGLLLLQVVRGTLLYSAWENLQVEPFQHLLFNRKHHLTLND